jgi:hypothetical protein
MLKTLRVPIQCALFSHQALKHPASFAGALPLLRCYHLRLSLISIAFYIPYPSVASSFSFVRSFRRNQVFALSVVRYSRCTAQNSLIPQFHPFRSVVRLSSSIPFSNSFRITFSIPTRQQGSSRFPSGCGTDWRVERSDVSLEVSI